MSKMKYNGEIRIVHLQRKSLAWRTRSAKRRKGKMRKLRASKYNIRTHILENTKREGLIRQWKSSK
jgi:hypothetical protein